MLLKKSPFDRISSWYSVIYSYLINHPNVRIGPHGDPCFQYDHYTEKIGDKEFRKVGINERLHIDTEKGSVGMHSPFWPSSDDIHRFLEDSCRKYGIQFTPSEWAKRDKNGEGYLEVEVNRLYPTKIQNLFNAVITVYDIKKYLKEKASKLE